MRWVVFFISSGWGCSYGEDSAYIVKRYEGGNPSDHERLFDTKEAAIAYANATKSWSIDKNLKVIVHD